MIFIVSGKLNASSAYTKIVSGATLELLCVQNLRQMLLRLSGPQAEYEEGGYRLPRPPENI